MTNKTGDLSLSFSSPNSNPNSLSFILPYYTDTLSVSFSLFLALSILQISLQLYYTHTLPVSISPSLYYTFSPSIIPPILPSKLPLYDSHSYPLIPPFFNLLLSQYPQLTPFYPRSHYTPLYPQNRLTNHRLPLRIVPLRKPLGRTLLMCL